MFSDEAINGYDAVAYFTKNKAVIGDDAFSYQWNGANWYFTNEENKNIFAENPIKYAPQYRGHCAFAVSKGFTADSNPNTFKILEGKLYLFDSESVKINWEADLSESLLKGEKNWNKINLLAKDFTGNSDLGTFLNRYLIIVG